MAQGTNNCVTIQSLSSEVLHLIFKDMHILDLLSLQEVCTQFQKVAGSSYTLKHASFFRLWPSTPSMVEVFQRAGQCKNLEALVKLAFAEMNPNIDMPLIENIQSLETVSWQAAEYFRTAEQLSTYSFSWVFVGLLCPLPESSTCHDVKKMFVEIEKSSIEDVIEDKALALQAVRELQEVVHNKPNDDNILNLCKLCIGLDYHGSSIDFERACTFTRRAFQSMKPLCVMTDKLGEYPVITPTLRFELVKRMVKIATFRKLYRSTLLLSIDILDRCLLASSFCLKDLELLVICTLVISSSCVDDETVLSAKEVAQLVKTKYSYQDIVEMTADIVGMLGGRIVRLTTIDILRNLYSATGLGLSDFNMACFILEVCALNCYMSEYSYAQISCSAIVLAKIYTWNDDPWNSILEKWTGYTLTDLSHCIKNLNACFFGRVITEQNIDEVKVRYDGGIYDIPENTKVCDPEALISLLDDLVSGTRSVKASLQLLEEQKRLFLCLDHGLTT